MQLQAQLPLTVRITTTNSILVYSIPGEIVFQIRSYETGTNIILG
jgi:hypothetical protein